MQGVTITRIPALASSSSKVAEVASLLLLVLLGLVVVPLLLVLALGGWLWDRVRPTPLAGPQAPPAWLPLVSRPELTLRYQYVRPATLLAGAAGYFEDEPLVRWEATPALPFFGGYFTDALRVVRTDGLFLQKVHFDTAGEQVLTMPLCFFSYQTQQAEELLDLKPYALDTKGRPNDFLLTATGEHETLHIHIRLVQP